MAEMNMLKHRYTSSTCPERNPSETSRAMSAAAS
jgi:hypothetical protein